jgi:hypothetical protein
MTARPTVGSISLGWSRAAIGFSATLAFSLQSLGQSRSLRRRSRPNNRSFFYPLVRLSRGEA